MVVVNYKNGKRKKVLKTSVQLVQSVQNQKSDVYGYFIGSRDKIFCTEILTQFQYSRISVQTTKLEKN